MEVVRSIGKAIAGIVVLALIGVMVFLMLVVIDSKYAVLTRPQPPCVTPKQTAEYDISPYLAEIQCLDNEIAALKQRKATIDGDIAALEAKKCDLADIVRRVLEEIQSQIEL